jgi:gliding-associated putative ABC transporter substrate-binding component GldG
VDTVKAPGIKKTVLLQTSANARTVSTPALISFESVKTANDPKVFNRSNIPVAVLLEGKFNSLYANRIGQAQADSLADFYKTPFLPAGQRESKMIVCADGDIVMNEVTQRGPLQMGYNKDINYTFSNRDFIQNCFEYVLNPSGILETRAKDFTLRLLDPKKVEDERLFWQFINILLPVLLVIAGGYIYQFLRKRKYQGSYL